MSTIRHARQLSEIEPTLGQELASFGDDDVVEMTNLQEDVTGIAGMIFISTAMGSHGPRVRYFVKAGRSQPSFSVSISDQPRILANSLPQRDLSRATASVIEWVRINKDVLLRLWNEGDSYAIHEVVELVSSLKRI